MFATAVYQRGAMTLQTLRERSATTGSSPILRDVGGRPPPTALGTTPEFIALAERISRQDLTAFFQAWLSTKGKPTTW